MNRISSPSIKFIFLSSILFFAFSCSNDKEDVLSLDQEVTSTEIKTILEVDDLSSVADDVVTQIFQDGLTGKRESKPNDCYEVDYSDTGYTVVFNSCELEGVENNVTGSLSVTYKIGEETSAFTAIYTNLMVGDIEINGTRSFTITGNTDANSVTFTIVSDMSIKLENGSLIQESGSKTFAVVFDTENISNSGLTIEGNWTVKVDDDTYVVNVTSALQTSFNCTYISKGTMDLIKNGLQVSVDFGDGTTCDDIAELIYPDGTKEEISLKD